MQKENSRISTCRNCLPDIQRINGEIKSVWKCVKDGWKSDQVQKVDKEICEKCECYKSRYIEFPIAVNRIDTVADEYWNDKNCGNFVKVRPCGEEFSNKTYLGIYLGRLPIGISVTYHENNRALSAEYIGNPAIFVPDLKKIIFGAESWWEKIETPEDLKEITDQDIENVWYVKALKTLKKN